MAQGDILGVCPSVHACCKQTGVSSSKYLALENAKGFSTTESFSYLVLTCAPASVMTSCAGSALRKASRRAVVLTCRALFATSRGV